MTKHFGNYLGLTNVTESFKGNKGSWNLFSHFYWRADGRWAESTITATGGTITTFTENGKEYKVHTFTGPNILNVTNGTDDIEYFIVSGGGGTSNDGGGGGGGGGILQGTLRVSGPVSIPVVIGAGGARATTPRGPAGNGSFSSFDSVSSIGGGAGGRYGNAGVPGGSGGGAGTSNGPATVASGFGFNPLTPSPVISPTGLPFPYSETQGNPGGGHSIPPAAPQVNSTSGGGGGAGGAGSPSTFPPNRSGNGGTGRETTFRGSPQFFAGGGGGGSFSGASASGTGGAGGGGNGATSNTASDGQANTGGGGGGAGPGPSPVGGFGANGGSGIVILKYRIS